MTLIQTYSLSDLGHSSERTQHEIVQEKIIHYSSKEFFQSTGCRRLEWSAGGGCRGDLCGLLQKTSGQVHGQREIWAIKAAGLTQPINT